MAIYEYKPITADEYGFRLILLHPGSRPEITIEVFHALLNKDDLMSYEAVSYVWGPSDMCASVYVQEFQNSGPRKGSVLESSLQVTNSLELVLRDLRLPDKKRCLWIDGICINQNDQTDQQSKEKNHQVQIMGKIYSHAERVLLHLGRPKNMMPILRDTLLQLQEHHDSQRISERKTHQGLERGQDVESPPEQERLQDLEQELETTLQDLEELQNLPETTEVQEQVRQKTQELEDKLREFNERQKPLELQKLHKPDNLRDEISEMDWEQVSSNLAERYTNFYKRILQSLDYVLAQPWFRRVWIIQEVANSREALIYWGPTSLSVRWFVDLVRKLGVNTDAHQNALLDLMPRSRREENSSSSGQDLYDLLVRFNGAEASKDHDRIFALLGMCVHGKGQGTIAIDYSASVKSVICDTIAYIGYCDKSDIPPILTMSGNFVWRSRSLLDDLVVDFVRNSKTASLRSLLSNRGDHITITPSMIERMTDPQGATEVISVLLEHRPDTFTVPVKALEHVSYRGDLELAEVLVTYCAEEFPDSVRWVRATRYKRTWKTPTPGGRAPTQSSWLTQLGQTILAGEVDDLRQLLEGEVNVNETGKGPLTPLSWAVIAGKQDMVAMLLDYGASIEASDADGQTALALAVRHGRENIVKSLLDRGASIKSNDASGRTPLSMAASGGFDGILSLGRSKHGARLGHHQSHRLVKDTKQKANTKAATAQIDEIYSAILRLLLDKGASIDSADNDNQTPLWWAVNYGHESAVEILLQNKANTGIISHGHMSLLSWAIWNGYEGIIARLLEHNALGAVSKDDALAWTVRVGNESLHKELIGRLAIQSTLTFDNKLLRGKNNDLIIESLVSAFQVAVKEGNAAAFKVLSQHQSFTKSSLPESEALLFAASEGHTDFAEILLEAGVDVNYENSYGDTPLSRAAQNGNREMVQFLLSKNSNPDGSSRNESTPLLRAICNNYTSIVHALLNSKANVDAESMRGGTALSEAVRRGRLDIARLLLVHGANVEACGSQGATTPLIEAAQCGRLDIARLLLVHGADVEACDSQGATSLIEACRWGRLDIARLLLVHGANVEACGSQGATTPLIEAAQCGRLDIARLLLVHGANVEACDSQEATPLMVACHWESTAIVKLLLDGGADVNARDDLGRTALDTAKRAENDEIVQMLEAKSMQNQ